MEIVAFLVVFMGVVLVHELGHFAFAKIFGVEVLEFAIGFGPALYVKKGKETKFRINVFPFGGYVRLSGENPYEEEGSEGRRFYDKPAWQRLLIALAGPIFSILAGYVIFMFIVNVWGVQFTGVDRVIEGSPAWEEGLKPGDMILKVNGRYVFDNLVISQEIRKGDEVELVVLRSGKRVTLTVRPRLIPPEIELWLTESKGVPSGKFESLNGVESPDSDYLSKLKGEFVKVEFSNGSVEGILENYGYVPERYAIGFVFAGLSNVFRRSHPPFEAGDELVGVGEHPVTGWLDLIRAYTFLTLNPDDSYLDILGEELEWWTRGATETVEVRVRKRDGRLVSLEISKGTLVKLLEDPSTFEPQMRPYKPSGFVERIEMAVARCNWILSVTWRFLPGPSIIKGIATGKVAGPVGIAGIVGEAVSLGMDTVLSLVAIITINLGLFNLLPLPALDGGRIVFALIEIITRRRIDPKIEAMIHTIGFILLMGLLFYITLMDFGRIMGR